MNQTKNWREPAGVWESLTGSMCAVGVLQDCWPGLGSHGMIVQICSPAPCFQGEGHWTLCLLLLHNVSQIIHLGPKRLSAKGWHSCTAISEATVQSLFLICAQACPQMDAQLQGKKWRCSSACSSAWG